MLRLEMPTEFWRLPSCHPASRIVALLVVAMLAGACSVVHSEAPPAPPTSAAQNADAQGPAGRLRDVGLRVTTWGEGSVKLQVRAAGTREPVKSYTASLKRVFSSDPSSVATAYDFTNRRVDPDDLVAEHDGEWALVHGVPPGNYRFQIADDQHAKTLGPQFTVQENAGPLEVVVPMGLGGTIVGVVIDDRGRPIPGARVSTELNDPLGPDFPRGGSQFVEDPEATRQSTRTDEQGRFVLSKLALCDYMLCVVHSRFCEGEATNLQIHEDGQLVDAGVIQLVLGTTISGTTMAGGQPMGQIKVQMSTPMTPEILKAAQDPNATPAEQQEAARQFFSVRVLSDGDGRFKLPKRVPPGTYRVTASRQGSQDMFRVLMDVKESERQVTIVAGQEDMTLDFYLAGN